MHRLALLVDPELLSIGQERIDVGITWPGLAKRH
jgi:hypothetical protein